MAPVKSTCFSTSSDINAIPASTMSDITIARSTAGVLATLSAYDNTLEWTWTREQLKASSAKRHAIAVQYAADRNIPICSAVGSPCTLRSLPDELLEQIAKEIVATSKSLMSIEDRIAITARPFQGIPHFYHMIVDEVYATARFTIRRTQACFAKLNDLRFASNANGVLPLEAEVQRYISALTIELRLDLLPENGSLTKCRVSNDTTLARMEQVAAALSELDLPTLKSLRLEIKVEPLASQYEWAADQVIFQQMLGVMRLMRYKEVDFVVRTAMRWGLRPIMMGDPRILEASSVLVASRLLVECLKWYGGYANGPAFTLRSLMP